MKEHKISIVERTTPVGPVVDLVIGDQNISTGENPIASWGFWDDMEGQVQRALYRIKTKNTRFKFEFDLSSMMLSKEQKRSRFISHLQDKNPDLDIEKVFGLIDTEVSKITLTGPDDNHPNPYMKFPIDSDPIKAILCSILSEYLKLEKK